MAELSQEKLEEMVVGKAPPLNVTFYEKAMLDVEKSKVAGKRVYFTTIYVRKKAPGVTDSISYRATEQDKRKYPEEYQHFLSTRQGAQKGVPIDIIPGLGLAHMQELKDMGLNTVEQLSDAKALPHHLDYAYQSARVLVQALQEQANGNEEESISEEGRTDEVPAADRPEHSARVGKPAVPARNGSQNEEAAEGNGAGRPAHSSPQSVNYGKPIIIA